MLKPLKSIGYKLLVIFIKYRLGRLLQKRDKLEIRLNKTNRYIPYIDKYDKIKSKLNIVFSKIHKINCQKNTILRTIRKLQNG